MFLSKRVFEVQVTSNVLKAPNDLKDLNAPKGPKDLHSLLPSNK